MAWCCSEMSGQPTKIGSRRRKAYALLFAMAVLFTLSFLLMVLGILADLIHNSRRLTEDALYKTRLMELRERRKQPSEK